MYCQGGRRDFNFNSVNAGPEDLYFINSLKGEWLPYVDKDGMINSVKALEDDIQL